MTSDQPASMETNVERAAILAERVARSAHRNDTDKAGSPLIEHVERVVTRLAKFPEDVRASAWLHDACESGGLGLDQLATEGFGGGIANAVDALTRRPEEDLDSYLHRVLALPISATVKRSDLTDNTRPERLDQLPEATRARLTKKYAKYLPVLGSFSTSTIASLLPPDSDGCPSISWAEADDCDPLMVYHSFPLPVAQAALSQTADASAAEPGITSTLRTLLPTEGKLHGLPDRLKSPSHLAEKLRRRLTGGKSADVEDQVRYTLVLPLDNLVELANDFFEDLRVRGWQCADLTHRYYRGSPYKGIHAMLRTHGAGSRVVELQVHTDAALRAKDASRRYFEMSQQRPGCDGRLSNAEITQRRIVIWAEVPTPPGLPELRFGHRSVELVRG